MPGPVRLTLEPVEQPPATTCPATSPPSPLARVRACWGWSRSVARRPSSATSRAIASQVLRARPTARCTSNVIPSAHRLIAVPPPAASAMVHARLLLAMVDVGDVPGDRGREIGRRAA